MRQAQRMNELPLVFLVLANPLPWLLFPGLAICHRLTRCGSKYTILTTHLYTCVIKIHITFFSIYFNERHWILIYYCLLIFYVLFLLLEILFDYYFYCNFNLIALANTSKTFLVDLSASASYCLRFLSRL